MGTQKNYLVKMVLLSTYMFWLRKEKNLNYALLSGGLSTIFIMADCNDYIDIDSIAAYLIHSNFMANQVYS